LRVRRIILGTLNRADIQQNEITCGSSSLSKL
jgi:hypothetical protein